jgi:hypothetical protein
MFLLKYILSWFLNMGEQSEDGFAEGCRFLGNSIEACTDIVHTSPMECGELVWEACRDMDK